MCGSAYDMTGPGYDALRPEKFVFSLSVEAAEYFLLFFMNQMQFLYLKTPNPPYMYLKTPATE